MLAHVQFPYSDIQNRKNNSIRIEKHISEPIREETTVEGLSCFFVDTPLEILQKSCILKLVSAIAKNTFCSSGLPTFNQSSHRYVAQTQSSTIPNIIIPSAKKHRMVDVYHIAMILPT